MNRPGSGPSGRGPATDSSCRASNLYASIVVPNTLRLRSQARSRGVEPCLTRISNAHCTADTRIMSGRMRGLRANAVSALSTTDSCPSTRWRLATSASSASSEMSDTGPMSGTFDGRNFAKRDWTESNSCAASTVGSAIARMAVILFSGGWPGAGGSCGAGPGVRADPATATLPSLK